MPEPPPKAKINSVHHMGMGLDARVWSIVRDHLEASAYAVRA